MPKNADKAFYERANAHIDLANQQLQHAEIGNVSASMMYGTARFNTSLTAIGFRTAAEMIADRQKHIDYFVNEYRLMLQEHMDDYIKNFDAYMKLTRLGD